MACRKPIVFVTYNRDKDWYEIQNRDRELIVAYPFKRCEADISPAKQYIHYAIVTKLAELQRQGYDIKFDLKTIRSQYEL